MKVRSSDTKGKDLLKGTRKWYMSSVFPRKFSREGKNYVVCVVTYWDADFLLFSNVISFAFPEYSEKFYLFILPEWNGEIILT